MKGLRRLHLEQVWLVDRLGETEEVKPGLYSERWKVENLKDSSVTLGRAARVGVFALAPRPVRVSEDLCEGKMGGAIIRLIRSESRRACRYAPDGSCVPW